MVCQHPCRRSLDIRGSDGRHQVFGTSGSPPITIHFSCGQTSFQRPDLGFQTFEISLISLVHRTTTQPCLLTLLLHLPAFSMAGRRRQWISPGMKYSKALRHRILSSSNDMHRMPTGPFSRHSDDGSPLCLTVDFPQMPRDLPSRFTIPAGRSSQSQSPRGRLTLYKPERAK